MSCKTLNISEFKNWINLSRSPHLSFLHSNLNGAKSHLHEFSDLNGLADQRCSVLAVTETRIFADEETAFKLDGYSSFFDSRTSKNPGGGVCLYVRSDITVFRRSDLKIDSLSDVCRVENVFVELVSSTSERIVVGVVYRQPHQDISSFFDAMECSLDRIAKENKSCFLLGDFNVDLLSNSAASTRLCELMACYSFGNLIDKPTRVSLTNQSTATCIDHIWTNVSSEVVMQSCVVMSFFSDHFSTSCIMPTSGFRTTSTDRPFTKYDLASIDRALQTQTWNSVLDADNVNEATKVFHSILLPILNVNSKISCKRKANNNNNKKWINDELLQLISQRDHSFRLWKACPVDESFREAFVKLRNKVTLLRRKLKFDYNCEVVKSGVSKGKTLWKIVNETLGRSTKVTVNQLDTDEGSVFNPLQIGNCLNKFFSSSVNIDSSVENKFKLPYYFPSVNSQFDFKHTSSLQMFFLLNKLKMSSSTPDQIPTFILKKFASYLCYPISAIVNLSISTGCFPQTWKSYRVIPLHKGGDPLCSSNYRPISIACPLAKILERVLLKQMSAYIGEQGILSEDQFGFRQGRNTQQAISSLVENLRNVKNRDAHSLACFVDLAKAFDSVSPAILSVKLNGYGFTDRACSLLCDFMVKRQQFVDIGGCFSSSLLVSYGVPQGSLLGPTLFSLFFNDFCFLPIFSKTILYADDTTLFLSGDSLSIISEQLNCDLFLINKWMAENCMSINSKKTLVLHIPPKKTSARLVEGTIQIESVPVKISTYIRFLGVSIDDKLSGIEYFSCLRRKLISSVASLSRIRSFVDSKTLLLLYHAFFGSFLSYGIETFGLNFSKLTSPIVLLQKRAIRIVTKSKFYDHTEPLFISCKVLPYLKLVEYSICVFIFKILCKMSPPIVSFKLSESCTRNGNNRLIILENCKKKCLEFSIRIRGATLWNALPVDLRGASISANSFKKKLKKYFL